MKLHIPRRKAFTFDTHHPITILQTNLPLLFFHCRAALCWTRELRAIAPGAARPFRHLGADGLVVLPVNVLDAKGDGVLGLREQDFRVYKDGRLQKIALFQRGDAPITVGLIMDHGRSMGSAAGGIAEAVCSFARSGDRRMRCSWWISMMKFRWSL